MYLLSYFYDKKVMLLQKKRFSRPNVTQPLTNSVQKITINAILFADQRTCINSDLQIWSATALYADCFVKATCMAGNNLYLSTITCQAVDFKYHYQFSSSVSVIHVWEVERAGGCQLF